MSRSSWVSLSSMLLNSSRSPRWLLPIKLIWILRWSRSSKSASNREWEAGGCRFKTYSPNALPLLTLHLAQSKGIGISQFDVELTNSMVGASNCCLELLLFAPDEVLGVRHTPSPVPAQTRCPMRLARRDLCTNDTDAGSRRLISD